MQKIIVIGRGAVGSTVLHNIKGSGEVFSLVDGERFSRLSPIVFNGETLSVPVVTPASPFEADLIINTVKNFSLESTLDTIAPFVGENTLILPLQNGIESEEVLGERFGEEKVIRAFIASLSTQREGSSVVSFSPGVIVFGDEDGGESERIVRVRDYLSSTRQPFRVSADIHHDQWLKYMSNTCFNTLTALMEYDYGTFMASDNLMRAVRLVAREVQTVAAAEGITISQDDIEGMIKHNISLPPRGRSSMCDDVLAGRPTENRWFCGTLSKKAKQHGLRTPYSDLLYMLLEAKSGR